MLTIGLVDFDLNNFHANRFTEILRARHADEVSVAAAWGMREESSARWASERIVAWKPSAAEVAQSCDAVMILAPDNAETHLDLARQVFPHAKRVFIDKTFAASWKEAVAIFEEADRHGVRLFSTSALRYAPALTEYRSRAEGRTLLDVDMRGPVGWSTYGVHVVEPVITLFGPQVKRLRASGAGKLIRVELEWSDGRTGLLTVNGHAPQPLEMAVTEPGNLVRLDLNDPAFYERLIEHVVRFFETGVEPVPRAETLAVARILDAATEARDSGTWIEMGALLP